MLVLQLQPKMTSHVTLLLITTMTCRWPTTRAWFKPVSYWSVFWHVSLSFLIRPLHLQSSKKWHFNFITRLNHHWGPIVWQFPALPVSIIKDLIEGSRRHSPHTCPPCLHYWPTSPALTVAQTTDRCDSQTEQSLFSCEQQTSNVINILSYLLR